ncbi:MAG: hypothetical protein R3332_10865 [Pseudohongiellaceae bacterium]|nr:hypothetical protein [Pseudohongiellaceae bacterium]
MYACIDLGSNSFHLLIAKWENGQSQIVERFSHTVQLGEGVTQTGLISAAAFERGLESLSQFAEVMKRYPIKRYWALGTNALRCAKNADRFLSKAKLMGIDISVISGEQEAILIYAGVLSGLADRSLSRMVIDIGGGSTEIIIGQGAQRHLTHSLGVGCVSWRDKYFTDIPLEADAIDQQLTIAASAAEDVFSEIQQAVSLCHWGEVIASSGTAKMLTAVCQQSAYSDDVITLEAMELLRPDVVSCALGADTLLPGLKDKRKQLLMPGWSVLYGLMRAFDVNRIKFSPTALREGMLDHMMHEESDAETPQDLDLLPEFSQTKKP